MALRENWVWERNEKSWKKKEEEIGRTKKTREQWRVESGEDLLFPFLPYDPFGNEHLLKIK